MVRNKILKVLLILSATWFLFTLVSVPKTDCQACSIDYNGKVIDGIKAWRIFEEGCISYKKPWNSDSELPSNINFTIVK